MLSSYDRAGGNRDWGNYEKPAAPDGRVDIANLKGPGVIHRIWMTGQSAEKWVFFFDGETVPRIRGIDPETADAKDGRYAFAKLQSEGSGGYTSYVPIPFAKSVRIAVPGDYKPRMPYYQVNYETYPRGTQVESFPATLSSSHVDRIDHVREEWDELDNCLTEAASLCSNVQSLSLAPRETHVWLDESGEGTLASFWCRILRRDETPIIAQNLALRNLVLRIWWDGAPKPSVVAPLGDFFANAFHYRKYSSFAIGNVGGRFICRFPMPFRTAAKAEVSNEGTFPIEMEIAARILPTRDERMRYFHCSWRQTAAYRAPAGRPHEVLSTKGRGHLAGIYLNSIGMEPNWFILEGDDIIYRDGEPRPSFHGTGLEDYFNGAWYYFGLSDLPFDGLLEKAAMRTAQYRFHYPDRVDFARSVRFLFEFGHVQASGSNANTSRGYMSSTAYWYQDRPTAARSLPSVAERRVPLDRLREATIMAEIIELELIGHMQEARERARQYASLFSQSATGPLMRLRTLAYDIVAGRAADPATALRQAKASLPTGPAAQAADDWSAIYENHDLCLLHVNTSCRFVCYLDGIPVSRGSNPRALFSEVVPLKPGIHECVVEVSAPGRVNIPWLSVCIQRADTNIFLNTSWEMRDTMPTNWQGMPMDKRTERWTRAKALPFFHPRYENWALIPNPYPTIQSQPMLRVDKAALGRSPQGRLYYRQRFNMAE